MSTKTVQKFGRNSDVPNGSWEGVLQAAPQFFWPQVATTVQVKAGGNAADDGTSSPLGAGAREIRIHGLDETGAEASETITLAGAAASSATTTTFIRVNRMYVTEVGAYGVANTDDIVLIDTNSPQDDLIAIIAGEGQTQYCGYTIPLGKTGQLKSAYVYADASKAADFILYTRENILDVTAPMAAKRVRHFWDGVLGSAIIHPGQTLIALPALTDIWIEARGGGAGTEVSAGFEILLTDS